MSKKLEDQARKFHYNLNRFNKSMTAYEGRLNNVQNAKIKQKQAEDAFSEGAQWGDIITANVTASDLELAAALEAFKELKKLLK